MKIYTNVSTETDSRLRAVLADGETVAGFLAAATEREIARRERGGKVVVTERRPGRPKKVSE